jgi:hypothetical protein
VYSVITKSITLLLSSKADLALFLTIMLLTSFFFSFSLANNFGPAAASPSSPPMPKNFSPSDDLKTVQVKLTLDQNKYKHLIGILQNTGNKTIDQVVVSAGFLDKDKKPLGNFSKQTELTTLNSYQITPFDILVYDKKINDRIKDYKVDFKFRFAEHKDKKLVIVSNDSRLDMTGFYFINGKIQNTDKTSASSNTNVIAITYNKNKELAGVWKAQTEPFSIPPLTTATFTIPVTDKVQAFQISNYTLLTESDNFSKLK